MTAELKFKKQADGSYGMPEQRFTVRKALQGAGITVGVSLFAAFVGYTAITSDEQATADKQALLSVFDGATTSEPAAIPSQPDIIGEIIHSEVLPENDEIGRLIQSLDLN